MLRVVAVVSITALALLNPAVSAAQTPPPGQPQSPLQFPMPSPPPSQAPPQQTQQPAQTQQPIKWAKLRSLLEQGYEIKGVNLVPEDVATRVVRKLETDGFILTLQKGAQIATCWYSIARYAEGIILDDEWCIPHR